MTKRKPSWKDVILALKGPEKLAGVAKLNASRPVLRSAMRRLEEAGEDYSSLEEWCQKTHGFGLNNRGTRIPVPGEERVYKAQGYPNSDASYGKTPLGSLGILKGGRFKARFEQDCIVLTRP